MGDGITVTDRWRTGRRVSVHLYRLVGVVQSDSDVPAGTALTPGLARELVDDANDACRARANLAAADWR